MGYSMNERELRRLVGQVKKGGLSRRNFAKKLLAVGLGAPVAAQILAHAGVAMAQSTSPYKPTKRGGGGTLRILWWQGPTLLNPHFAPGTKDQDGARIFYEPLACFDPDGNLSPILAAEIPTRENGGVASDGKSVTWKLKKGVKWHDGHPFSADDLVFNWEYAKDPATAATTIGSFKDIKVEKIDDYTVKVIFDKATPFWATVFVGTQQGQIIPKHLFAAYTGAKSREAPTNLAPVGTGPYKFKDFKPGDLVAGAINTDYHMDNRPYFDAIEMKGGGDAVSAARAVLQTGEYDFAWNMQVEDEVLARLEKGGKGHVLLADSGSVEYIAVNSTDPWTEVDGERSSIKTKHPTLSDPAVREALAYLVDKASVEKFIYGRGGPATNNFLNFPKQFRSTNIKDAFNVDKANEILDKGGWKKGSDGIREKDGKKLKYVFQTSINQPRQKTQAIIKQACQKAGIDIEIKAVTASVFFSADVANPDTYPHFYADLEMYTTTMPQPDPQIFMNQFCSWEAASKANKWQGRNITRWQNAEYDKTFKEVENELDPVKRAALCIKLNDLACGDHAAIGVVMRPNVAACSNKLTARLSGWDSYLWDLQNWFKEG
jgi:peptide/nickel transport system substrate-binding protein